MQSWLHPKAGSWPFKNPPSSVIDCRLRSRAGPRAILQRRGSREPLTAYRLRPGEWEHRTGTEDLSGAPRVFPTDPESQQIAVSRNMALESDRPRLESWLYHVSSYVT